MDLQFLGELLQKGLRRDSDPDADGDLIAFLLLVSRLAAFYLIRILSYPRPGLIETAKALP
ncbi:MAG: hypothetical protein KJ936_13015 [Proteobacteria bacterium]|nr:hypothetical protein [Pseudomonadota bacterium]MBU2228560.1 hypothetical protein [Pseudomonadota bacterium]